MHLSVRGVLAKAILAGTLLTPTAASAAPITLFFDVSVDSKYAYATDETIAIDPITFLLSMTLDDAILTVGTSTRLGDPTFLGVPDALVVPTAALEGPVSASRTFVRVSPSGTSANAIQSSFPDDAPSFTELTIRLSGSIPSQDTQDIAGFLAVMNSDLQFEYDGYTQFGRHTFSADSFRYSGSATQVPVPVPEPGALTLLGLGLAVGVAKLRRFSVQKRRDAPV
jgi:hypothetical protein